MGIHKRRTPRTRRKPLKGRAWNLPDFSWMRTPELPECGNNMSYTPATKSLVEQLRDENKIVAAEMKRNMESAAPICNKGAYQFISKGDDLNGLGRKK